MDQSFNYLGLLNEVQHHDIQLSFDLLKSRITQRFKLQTQTPQNIQPKSVMERNCELVFWQKIVYVVEMRQ